MKKIITVIFLLLSFILIAGTINVEERTDGIYVFTRFMEYKFDYNGNLVEVYRVIERRTRLFLYSNDGFDIENVNSTPTFNWQGLKDGEKYSEVTLKFDYDKMEKIYNFKEGPNYTFNVVINSTDEITVSLPRVGYEVNDRLKNNIFLSFYEKGDILSIIKFQEKR